VAEGLTDTFALDQGGYPSVGRLGWQLSHTQIKLLRDTGSNPTIVIDNDHLMKEQTSRYVALGFDVAYTPLEFKDPGQMLQETGAVQLNIFPASLLYMRGLTL